MATFNLRPILYPRPKPDDVAKMMKDFIDILKLQYETEGGGQIRSLDVMDDLIAKKEASCRDLSGADKRVCIKDLLRLQKDRVELDVKISKTIGADKLELAVNESLTDLGYDYPNDLSSYIKGTREVYQTAADKVSGFLDKLEEYDYEDIGKLIDLGDKYFRRAIDMKKIRTFIMGKDLDRLRGYGVHYRLSPEGEVIEMGVKGKNNMPPNTKASNITTEERLPVYFTESGRPDETGITEIVDFGDNRFTYQSALNRFQTANPEDFNWEAVRHETIATAKDWGDFIKDNANNKYFVTKEGKLASVDDDTFRRLGGTEAKLHKMSGWEKRNLLPYMITTPIELVPERIEKLQRESIWLEYEAEKAAREAELIKPYFWRRLLRVPERWYPTELPEERLREYRERARQIGVRRYLPPKEPEAVEERTEEIFKGLY